MGGDPPEDARAARVLVAVADARLRRALRRALGQDGHEVLGGRAEARAAGAPDVVVSEWPPPRPDGSPPAWRGPGNGPVVALAADPAAAREALAAGAADCVLGRVRATEVALRVAAVLARLPGPLRGVRAAAPGAGDGDAAADAAGPSPGVIDALPAGVAVLGPAGTLARANAGFRALLGLPAGAVGGVVGRDVLVCRDPGALEDLFRRARREGTASGAIALAGGTGPPLTATVTATRDDTGTVSAYVLTLRGHAPRARFDDALARLAQAARAPDADVFAVLAREAAGLVAAPAAVLVRAGDPGPAIVGRWGTLAPAPEAPVRGAAALARALLRPAARGGGTVLTAPLRVAGRAWGALAVAAPPDVPASEGRAALLRFAELAAIAVAEGDPAGGRAAARDPLTGVLTLPAFFGRLGEALTTGGGRARPVALALVDVDLPGAGGHHRAEPAREQALAEVARRLADHARPGDLVGRTGAGEFGWLMQGTGPAEALELVRRARRDAAGAVPRDGRVVVSAGVAASPGDGGRPVGAEDLHRQAEVALQWARMSGRGRAVAYSFSVAEQVFARQSALLAETPSLRAMRALAWAVDARDPHTHRHSMRVADVAVRIGAALGWPAERLGQLREAGLVHDVGKIAVPDNVLFKPGPLTPEEFAVIRRHPSAGAQIVADVLSPEQARWVHAHHERWDGAGYPDGLRGDAIPEEARVLAVADAWDVMVSLRSYKEALPPAEALAELQGCAGSQFWSVAVEALARLVVSGALDAADTVADLVMAGTATTP